MAMVQAISTIQRATKPGVDATDKTKRKPPETEEIKNGTIFECSGEELEELEGLQAVRRISPEEAKQAEANAGVLDTGRRVGRRSSKQAAKASKGGRRGRLPADAPSDTAPATKGSAAKAVDEGKGDGTTRGVKGGRKANDDDLVG
jgi:hypothetical protein